MQRVIFQQADFIQIQSQASRVLPGHGTGAQQVAINDDVYENENSVLRLVFSVLGNVIGGLLLLSGLFVLPHVLAGIMG
jgi:hypothetical protein